MTTKVSFYDFLMLNSNTITVEEKRFSVSFTDHDWCEAKQHSKLTIVIKSQEAFEVFQKIAAQEEYEYETERNMPKSAKCYLTYDAETASDTVFSYSEPLLDEVRAELEKEFGKPETETAPIKGLGYEETENDHWAIWSQDVYLDEDGDIIEFEQH